MAIDHADLQEDPAGFLRGIAEVIQVLDHRSGKLEDRDDAGSDDKDFGHKDSGIIGTISISRLIAKW